MPAPKPNGKARSVAAFDWSRRACHCGADCVRLFGEKLAVRIRSSSSAIPLAVRMEDRELKKGPLREAAHFLGVPEIAVKRKKKAFQYGSGVHKILIKEFGQKAVAQAANTAF